MVAALQEQQEGNWLCLIEINLLKPKQNLGPQIKMGMNL